MFLEEGVEAALERTDVH